MSPNVPISSSNGVLYQNDTCSEKEIKNVTETKSKVAQTETEHRLQLVWFNITIFAILHAAALYGVYLMFISAKISTSLVGIFLHPVIGLGVTAGAHRLWAHRSYKAKWPLRLLLMILNTTAFEGPIINWVRDHRLHHKYTDTDADPHNSNRGFFFCHIGWLMCRKHPAVKEKGKGIDLSDLYEDPILRFQKKYYWIILPILCFVIPTASTMYFLNETFANSLFVVGIFRFLLTFNITCTVNSFAHLYGNKPYDRFINPAENRAVAFLALGEGWHNFHHAFPWDYKTGELGSAWLNITTPFINFFAKIGWAYDLKSVSMEMVKKRVQRTGDGSHEIWGWGDKDQPQEERDATIVTHKHSD